MNHTKEPWKTYKGNTYEIFANDGDVIASSEECHIGHREAAANAKRIVACVNACADIEDKKLKLGYVKELEAENAELRKVLLQNGYNAKLRG